MRYMNSKRECPHGIECRKLWLELWQFIPLGSERTAAGERQKGEIGRGIPLTQLPFQKHAEGRQDQG